MLLLACLCLTAKLFFFASLIDRTFLVKGLLCDVLIIEIDLITLILVQAYILIGNTRYK